MTRNLLCMCTAGLLVAACGGDPAGNDNQNQNQPDASEPIVCGNGVTQMGETCDDGAENSDFLPDACRTTCRLPFCGDGVTDSDEQCDEGTANSDRIANACRSDCLLPSCGDGIIDDGEACDDATANGDTPGACRTSCQLPACEDGIPDPGLVCVDYFGVVSPPGFMNPMDLDGDALPDLVGGEESRVAILQTFQNTGGGFGQRHSYLVQQSDDPRAVSGALSSGATQTIVAGSGYPLVAPVLPGGRLSLPSALYTESGHSVAGLNGAAGLRLFIYSVHDQHCRVTLDASGALDLASQDCQPAGQDLPLLAPPVQLSSTDGSLIVAGPSHFNDDISHHEVSWLELDPLGRFTRLQRRRWPAGDGDVSFGSWVGPAERVGDAMHWAAVYLEGFTGRYRLSLIPWDPTQASFGAPVIRDASDLLALGTQPGNTLLTMGDFGGGGQYKDAAVALDNAGLAILRHHAGGYALFARCDAKSYRTLVAADLDGDGDDEIVGSRGGLAELEVHGFGGVPLDCSVSILATPCEPASAQRARVNGDGFDDVIIRCADDPFAQGTSNGGVGGLVLKGGSSLSLESVITGPSVTELWAFARAVSADTADVVFTTSIDVGGDWESPAGVITRDSDRFVTGYQLRAAGESAPLRDRAVGLRVGDVDGDGQQDLVLITDMHLHTFYGPFDPTTEGFASHETLALGSVARGLWLADLDGDDLPEALLLSFSMFAGQGVSGSEVTVYGNSGGSFVGPGQPNTTEFEPGDLTVGDFDGDGDLDVATVHPNASVVAVLLNDGAGVLQLDRVYLTPGIPFTVTSGRLDGDDQVDLIISTPLHGLGPLWLAGKGDGTFEPAEDLGLTASEFWISLIDMTGDGHEDLMINRSLNDSYLAIVLQATP